MTFVHNVAQTAQAYFDAADQHFEDEEPLLAYENIWHAAEHALTAVAEQRGWPTDDARALKTAADRLADEASDHHLRHQYAVAQQFRAKFNHGFVEPYQLADYCRLMREFVARMVALLDEGEPAVSLSVGEYAQAARKCLQTANTEFASGAATQGSATLWQSAAHAVTAVAVQRGWPADRHQDVKAAADRLAADTGNTAIAAGFFAAQQFQANSRHDFMQPDDIARGRPLVQDFVHRVLSLLES